MNACQAVLSATLFRRNGNTVVCSAPTMMRIVSSVWGTTFQSFHLNKRGGIQEEGREGEDSGNRDLQRLAEDNL